MLLVNKTHVFMRLLELDITKWVKRMMIYRERDCARSIVGAGNERK
ncbi:hypothetical protein C3B79_2480 [Aeromonas hydrophila]|nr:hypothetical protein C3B79_2480 [Aeromonas hydrophila]